MTEVLAVRTGILQHTILMTTGSVSQRFLLRLQNQNKEVHLNTSERFIC